MLRICNACQDPLTTENTYKWRGNRNICKKCECTRKRQKEYETKLEALTVYGGKCACCPESNPIFLNIDHIDGNGSQHRKSTGLVNPTGDHFYHWLKKNGFPKDNYQVLCFNCNFAKHVLGTCPHQLNNHK